MFPFDEEQNEGFWSVRQDRNAGVVAVKRRKSEFRQIVIG